MKVYLDNGATTQVDKDVAKVMQKVLVRDYGNPSSLHEFGEQAKALLEESRRTVAKAINASADEIFFTSGGTESNNIAIRGILKKTGKKHFITTKIEHPSVTNLGKDLEKNGYKVSYLNVDKEGFVSLKDLESKITKNTGVVAIIHGNNEVGVIQNMKKIGALCEKYKVALHTDAVQSFTKVPIDVKEFKLTSMAISSHKIHGPKGVGAVYIKRGVRVKSLVYGGHQENNVRPGTENLPGIVGFAKAVEIGQPVAEIRKLRDKLIEGLLKIPNTMLNGSREHRLCNNVNISFKKIEGESILMMLNMVGVAVSTGSACSSKSLDPSHVLIAMGMKHGDAHGSIRFTLSKYTTEKEIEYTVKEVKKVVEKLRRMSPVK
tara:strand:- start:436 stop:1563 length:1128 start_codon:yes stop_codon:yes gene_type:complete